MIFQLTFRKSLVLALAISVKSDAGPTGPVEDQLGPKQSHATLTGSVLALWIPDNKDG